MPQSIRVLTALLLISIWTGEAAAQSPEAGKTVFLEKAEPPCGLCHTLEDAGATGEIGPDLDELQPNAERVGLAVSQGVGNMPPYGDSLSAAEIAAVARYVAEAVKAGK